MQFTDSVDFFKKSIPKRFSYDGTGYFLVERHKPQYLYLFFSVTIVILLFFLFAALVPFSWPLACLLCAALVLIIICQKGKQRTHWDLIGVTHGLQVANLPRLTKLLTCSIPGLIDFRTADCQ